MALDEERVPLGNASASIARELGVDPKTVATSVSRFRKFGLVWSAAGGRGRSGEFGLTELGRRWLAERGVG